MPGRNGTGPLGQGSRTGRGMGNCKPPKASVEQTLNSAQNLQVMGGGRGWGNWFTNMFRRRRANRVNWK